MHERQGLRCWADLLRLVRLEGRGQLREPGKPGLWAALRPGVHRGSGLPGARGGPVALYAVTYSCPRGKVHEVTASLVLDPSPDHLGTVARLWPGGGLPPAFAVLLGDLVWRDGQAEHMSMRDPEQVTVAPPAETGTDNAEGHPDQPDSLEPTEGVVGSVSS